MSFNHQRLGIVRARRMLSQKGLAEIIGLTPHTISRCEKGLHAPTEETITALAKALNYPREFFFREDIDRPSEASFRSLTSMTASVRDAALSAGSIGFLVSDWVEERFNLPDAQLHDLSLFEPEDAARVLREAWGLGERPVSNMVHLLESKGVRVFSLSEETRHLNAFSIWRRSKPYAFLNTFKSGESSRYDAAHELCHLVMHQDGVRGRVAEEQANKFASAFLMPRASVLASLPTAHSLAGIVRAKSIWRVSVAALNYRLHKIGVISDWQYRDFCIQIAQNRFHTTEPQPIQREASIVWQKVLRLLWQERKTVSSLANELALPESEVTNLIFGTLTPNGEGKASRPIAALRLA